MIQCYRSAFVIIPIGEEQTGLCRTKRKYGSMQDQKDGLDYAGPKEKKGLGRTKRIYRMLQDQLTDGTVQDQLDRIICGHECRQNYNNF
jgi:hypothetical protein